VRRPVTHRPNVTRASGPCPFPKEFGTASQLNCEDGNAQREKGSPTSRSVTRVDKHQHDRPGGQKDSDEENRTRDVEAIGIAGVNSVRRLVPVDRQKPEQPGKEECPYHEHEGAIPYDGTHCLAAARMTHGRLAPRKLLRTERVMLPETRRPYHLGELAAPAAPPAWTKRLTKWKSQPSSVWQNAGRPVVVADLARFYGRSGHVYTAVVKDGASARQAHRDRTCHFERSGFAKPGRAWAVALVALALVCACDKGSTGQRQGAGRKSPTIKSNASAADSGVAANASGRTRAAQRPQSPTKPPQTPQEMLTEWTRALNEADLGALESLYAGRVRFYGTWLTRDEVLKRKRDALAATRNFKQAVLGNPSLEKKGDVSTLGFRKRSGPADAQHDVFATLVLRRSPQLLIEEETDAATEKRYGSASTSGDVPKDCVSAVWLMVDSTPVAERLYKDINRNLGGFPKEAELHPGGMGPLTPHETGDGTYELAIGVHHPERFEAYAWFTVDPTGKVTVSAFTLELSEATTTPSPEALRHFGRLCTPH
jgi:hypothetical protein